MDVGVDDNVAVVNICVILTAVAVAVAVAAAAPVAVADLAAVSVRCGTCYYGSLLFHQQARLATMAIDNSNMAIVDDCPKRAF